MTGPGIDAADLQRRFKAGIGVPVDEAALALPWVLDALDAARAEIERISREAQLHGARTQAYRAEAFARAEQAEAQVAAVRALCDNWATSDTVGKLAAKSMRAALDGTWTPPAAPTHEYVGGHLHDQSGEHLRATCVHVAEPGAFCGLPATDPVHGPKGVQ